MPKMTKAQAQEWSKKMAAAKARKHRKSNPKRKHTAKRHVKRTVARRHHNPTRRTRRHVSRRRRTNPIDWKELAVQGAGLLVGAYSGWAVGGFVGDNLVEKLPATIRGIAYAGAGFGLLAAGYALRPHAPKLPILAAISAASVPLWLRMFATFNLLPTGVTSFAAQAPNVALSGPSTGTETVGAGLFKRLMPRRPIRRAYLPAAGTIARGPSPGMRGSFGEQLSPGVRTGRHLV